MDKTEKHGGHLVTMAFSIANLTVLMLLLLPVLNVKVDLWWLDNLLNLQLQWSFLALLLLVINLLMIKKRRLLYAFLYGTMITYNLMPLYLPSVGHDQNITKTTPTQLTIAQLNLSYDNPHIAQLLPLLGDKKFDLLVLQEASDKESENIKKLAGYYPYSFGIAEATPSGMAILSRYQISEKHLYELGHKGGHVLEVILQIPGLITPIQLFELHPGSPRTEKLWQLRNQTLTKIAEMVVASPFANKIVIGDFNSSHWTTAFANFEKISHLKNSALGFGYIPSWAFRPSPSLSLISSVYLDHCLVSPSFEVLNKKGHSITGSDHLLLITQLAI